MSLLMNERMEWCFLGHIWCMDLFLDQQKKSEDDRSCVTEHKVPLGMTQHYAICLSKSPAVFNSHPCVGRKIWKWLCSHKVSANSQFKMIWWKAIFQHLCTMGSMMAGSVFTMSAQFGLICMTLDVVESHKVDK